LERLVAAGIRTCVGMAPILPGISDRPDQLAEVVRAARDAGACGIWANTLHLQPGTREHFLESLEQAWPELLPEYERLYSGRAYLPASETAPVREAVRRLAVEHGIRDRRRMRLEPPPAPEQLVLSV
jgi:DNA repair photolyase